ncbi:MAG TPA: hypothetical protein PKL04_06635 [Methanofastidiosum sp.]|nr:hypothetical protein [Methanofastidiosum sp.]
MESLNKEFVLDPRINPVEPSYIITRGSQKQTFVNYPSQAYSESNIQIQALPPSPGTYLDRKALVSLAAEWTLTAANPANTIFPPGATFSDLGVGGLRYMPLNNIAQNFQIQMNGNSWSYNCQEIFAPMSQYDTPTDPLESLYWSYGPSMKTPSQTYAQSYGTPRSPFAPRWTNTDQDSNSINFEIVSNVPGTAVIRCRWTEPILYPLFISGILEHEGLIGLNSAIILTWTLPGLARMLGYDQINGEPLSNIVGTWLEPPTLRLQWLTSDFSSVASSLTSRLAYKYPFTNITPFTSPPVLVNAGSSVFISAPNIQLTGIPHCMYVYAREILQDRTPYDADSFARINSSQIIFDNQSGILANASAEHLYAISVQNGLKVRYNDWITGVGSVLKLQYDKDIPLAFGKAVGVPGTFQLNVSLNITNINPDPINYSLYVIVCYEGIATIMDGALVTNINLVSEADVIADSASADRQSLSIAERSNTEIMDGGSILSKTSNFIKRGNKFYKDHKETIHRILQVGKTIGLVAADVLPALLGAGMDYDQAKEALLKYGYSHNGRGLTGGGLTGGKLISHNMDLITGNPSHQKPHLKLRNF